MSSINNTNTYIDQPKTCSEEEVSYKECCRNHAIAMGGACYDGCNEYLQASGDNISAENSFLCACCGCHRNFHRRYIVSNSQPQIETEENDGRNEVPVSEPCQFADIVGVEIDIQRFCTDMGFSLRMFVVFMVG
ncbi:unnamed protein product [Sphenostylis stenocarpa]|uniref:ZF-HD dimerization-type domain-containing protein n=1 Tax=Sphenostylis stenocarpa TaxID=92480 RepID=A0AA86SP83_9FABA|nr:unnamed protein product [Sphenostylis stenocarpa]